MIFKLNKVDTYVITEVMSLAVVIMATLSSIMFMIKIPAFAEFIFSSPNLGTTIISFLVYTFPTIFKLTLPVSLLLSCTVVTMRMSADRELEACLAGGASIIKIARAPMILGLLMSALSMICSLFLEPYANNQFEKYKWLQARKFVQSFIESKLKDKYFIYDFLQSENNKIAFYFDEVSSSKQDFSRVFISAQSEKRHEQTVILAQKGTLLKKNNAGFSDTIFTLIKGEIFSARQSSLLREELIKKYPEVYIDKTTFASQNFNAFSQVKGFAPSLDWTLIYFSEIHLSLMSIFKNKFNVNIEPEKDIRGKYPLEYMRVLKQQRQENPNWRKSPEVVKNHSYFVQQIVIPFSCLFLSMIGMCLGVQDPRRKHVAGYLGIGLVVFVYYSTFTICQQLSVKGLIHPAVNLFVTPIVLLVILFVLLYWRLKYPPSTKFLEFIFQEIKLIKRNIMQ
ncbi:MAG: LptF/LptG family permease [Silvanigrellaceae bacterium]|nr:LptF/LptG family permease [Silvanigrellaceae bacterium]